MCALHQAVTINPENLTMNPIAAALSIRNATLDAHRRTGDQIRTVMDIGYFRVERVTYEADVRVVTPLTGWTKAEKVIEFLDAL